jgi:hypothetical protein
MKYNLVVYILCRRLIVMKMCTCARTHWLLTMATNMQTVVALPSIQRNPSTQQTYSGALRTGTANFFINL